MQTPINLWLIISFSDAHFKKISTDLLMKAFYYIGKISMWLLISNMGISS